MKDPVEAGRPLADAITAETARRALTQDEAAKLIGTSQQTFGKWVNGQVRPSDDRIPALAKYLSMTEETVRQLRGPMRADPRDRMVMRRRIEELEARLQGQEEQSRSLLARLEAIAQRLDALDLPDD